jgi:uncharacterized protein YjiS (DUF1127 family)
MNTPEMLENTPGVLMERKMTSIHTSGHVLGLIAAPFHFVNGVARRFRHRREMNRLLGMPDYILKDVGVQRSDIQREAVRPLW